MNGIFPEDPGQVRTYIFLLSSFIYFTFYWIN